MARHTVGGVEKKLPEPVVILANGDLLTHRRPLSTLKSAGTLICTDGAAVSAVIQGRNPDIVIGDMDSLDKGSLQNDIDFIEIPHHDSTDLEKALDWCMEQGVTSVTLLGLSGGREDHMLANFSILADCQGKLNLMAITDHHTVHPISAEKQFQSISGATVSLLTANGQPEVTTAGLRYPLEKEPLRSGGHGISNVTEGDNFSVGVTGGLVLVFIGHGD
ncbi:MAG: thiamine diphosphokinase [Candidatus Neomarinimicrobiota bacterium]|nr:thiamine diphosphokinase [Candidatus Neomarinimicrobiota bacterium]